MKTSVKGKLHGYIDHADEKKINAIYTLVKNEIDDRSSLYDEATLDSFRKTSKDYAAGKMKGYSVEESMKRVRKTIGRK
jgi:hypothetical protein